MNVADGYVALVNRTRGGEFDFSTGLLRSPDGVMIPAGVERFALVWSAGDVRASCAPDDDDVLASYPIRPVLYGEPHAEARRLPAPRSVVDLDESGSNFRAAVIADWPLEHLRCAQCCASPDHVSPAFKRIGGCDPGEEVHPSSFCDAVPVTLCCIGSTGIDRAIPRFLSCLRDESLYDAQACAEVAPSSACSIDRTCSGDVAGIDKGALRSLCFRRTDGTIKCFQLPYGTGPQELRRPWAQVASGTYHECGLLADGRIECSGDNRYGQLGLGDVVQTSSGAIVKPRARWIALGAHQRSTCAIDDRGAVRCWGRNDGFQLGTDEYGMVYDPIRVDIEGPASRLVMGYESSCAILASGEAICWGRNGGGILGGAATPRLPSAIPGRWRELSIGDGAMCGIDVGGDVLCWGTVAGRGQGWAPVERPVTVAQGAWTSIAAGSEMSCAIDGSRSLACWGIKAAGTCDFVRYAVGPMVIGAEGRPWRTVATDGRGFACGVDAAGSPVCWGRRDNVSADLLADPTPRVLCLE